MLLYTDCPIVRKLFEPYLFILIPMRTVLPHENHFEGFVLPHIVSPEIITFDQESLPCAVDFKDTVASRCGHNYVDLSIFSIKDQKIPPVKHQQKMLDLWYF